MDTNNANRILMKVELLERGQSFFKRDKDTHLNEADYPYQDIDDCLNNRTDFLDSIKISNVVPQQTRFRFCKRVFNKLIKFFSNQQVEFNKATVNVVWAQNKKLEMLSGQCAGGMVGDNSDMNLLLMRMGEVQLHLLKLEDEIALLKKSIKGEINK